MLRKIIIFLDLPSDDLIEGNGLMNVATEDLLLQELSWRNVERLNRSEKLKKTKTAFKIVIDIYFEKD